MVLGKDRLCPVLLLGIQVRSKAVASLPIEGDRPVGLVQGVQERSLPWSRVA